MIRVLFLAQLREQIGTSELQVAAADAGSVAALRQYLINSHPQWEKYLANGKLLVAVNHEYAKTNVAIKPGDEVAFFPPVTGG